MFSLFNTATDPSHPYPPSRIGFRTCPTDTRDDLAGCTVLLLIRLPARVNGLPRSFGNLVRQSCRERLLSKVSKLGSLPSAVYMA